MERSAHMQKFCNVDSIDRQCMKTLKILSEDAGHAKDTAI